MAVDCSIWIRTPHDRASSLGQSSIDIGGASREKVCAKGGSARVAGPRALFDVATDPSPVVFVGAARVSQLRCLSETHNSHNEYFTSVSSLWSVFGGRKEASTSVQEWRFRHPSKLRAKWPFLLAHRNLSLSPTEEEASRPPATLPPPRVYGSLSGGR